MFVLTTERLGLRRLTPEDLDAVYAMLSDPEVMRYYPSVRDREQSQVWLDYVFASYERHGYGLFAVQRLDDGRFVGQIGLLHWDDVDDRPDVEVGYLLAREHWGQGYATEAAIACKRYAFATLRPDRVVSYIDPRNVPSIAVAQRNGMQLLKRLETSRWNKPMLIYGTYDDRA